MKKLKYWYVQSKLRCAWVMQIAIEAAEDLFDNPYGLNIIKFGQGYLERCCRPEKATRDQRGHLSEDFAGVEEKLEDYGRALRAAERRGAEDLETSPKDMQ